MTRFLSYLVASLTAGSAVAVILGEVDSLRETYDFVIVGGGTAGLVVANRLTEISKFNVLVLEAGPTDAGVLEIEVPFLCTHTTPQTPWDWNYTTIPQAALNGASLTYPRGHVLGGTSSVNCLVYTRGSQADFDRYAQVTGDSGWSWKSMLPYFKKSEKFTRPSDNHNTTGQFDPAVHGFSGFNSVSLPGASTAIDNRFNEAVGQLGGEFFEQLDYNSGTPLGFGWSQAVIDGPSGTRSSSSSGYLQKKILERPNLHVLVNAQVSRILHNSKAEAANPLFSSVEYRINGKGSLRTVTATKEIILSAGSINTPQILLNSGVGGKTALEKLDIVSQVDIEDVGQNLSDHPIITFAWLVNASTTYDDFNRNITLQNEEIQIWNKTRQGVFVNGIAQHIGFVRVPDNSSIFQSAPNPSSGPNSPHFEIFVSNFLLGNTPPTGQFLSISAIMLTPGVAARGSVTITSNDPFSTPVIDAGLMRDNGTDLPLMREAVRSILRLASAPTWANYIIGPASSTQPNLNSSDNEIDAFIKGNARSAYHVVGTSSMSKKGAKTGVVDPNLLLKHAAGVRIVDASVLPFVPAGHTQASTYALAERAADLIKADFAMSS
ncbi:Pyranose dehydrogenase 3 [Psilocybe cubensis]|uniref:Pyranose dehydrogenase 3 n=2 Tax=Psilocybe cubensis TaxID=181762 RepID=A0ACB8GWL2_PSICU|nr:Pyranose dehydrogenase 3 [Psilocybe cubensis]KAH9480023.1 Pyranose dehydrogenase 3 [Psilocybe cubensis]